MAEYPQFCDGWLLPKDYRSNFNLYLEQYKLKSDQEDEFLEEKYVVKTIDCKGAAYQPTCIYDFTKKIRIIDMFVQYNLFPICLLG